MRQRGGQRLGQRLLQRHQLARAHLAQRNARGDALHVAAAFQRAAQRVLQPAAQLRDGLQPLGRFLPVAARAEQPALQGAAAHARHAGVQQ